MRLRNLKRRAGFDANILPAKKPAQSDANRQAKVNNIEIVLTQGDWFALYGKNKYFQARQQEDEAQREARLADKRHRQAVVRFVFVVVVVVVITIAMVTVIDN